MNKKSMTISIVLLVIFTLVLIIVSLTYFIIKKNSNQEQVLMVPNEIDSLNLEADYLDYYLNNLFLDSTKEFKPIDGKNIIIKNLNENLPFYKDYYIIKNIDRIKQQINENNINITSEKLIWYVEFTIESDNLDKTGIKVRYNYKRNFEKAFKVINLN